MVLFKSKHPHVQVPEDLTVWEWLFESPLYSPLHSNAPEPLAGFIDVECKERLDWVAVCRQSAALSTCWTREYDLMPGQTVSIFTNNTIWYPVCMLAAVRAGTFIHLESGALLIDYGGARLNGASAAFTIDEMVYALTVAKAKIVVAIQSSFQKACTAASQVGIPLCNVFLMSGDAKDIKNTKTVQDLIQQGLSLPVLPPYRLPAGTTNKKLCGFLNFSSGTTGLPKPVMISHHNVIAICLMQQQVMIKAKKLAVMPVYHIIGTWHFCLFPILLNVDSIMLSTFTMQSMLKAMDDFEIEEMVSVPPIVLRLARESLHGYDLRHVKRWNSGAAPISPEVLKSLERRFPGTGFRGAYGATEAAVITTTPQTHYAFKYATSVGMLLPNTVAKVIDLQGRELGPGETGEILAKGPQVAMGYLDNEKSTRESFGSDGFYHTGDLGHFDEEGCLFIQDRIKEMIKVKGNQVAPAELEDLLLGHEMVADCAVIGQLDEYAGELPKAFVVLNKGFSPSENIGQKMFEYVKEKKTRYKWLAEIEFVETIPKSPSGKLLRQKLRDADRNGAAKVNSTWSVLRVRDAQLSRIQK